MSGISTLLDATVVNDDGGWCWFQDPRAITCEGRVVVGSVATGRHDPRRTGNIELAAWNPRDGSIERRVLHENLQADDHNAPALLQRSDGRLLAMYSKHSSDGLLRYRVSREPGDPTRWRPERHVDLGPGCLVCYNNLLSSRDDAGVGRIDNITRVFRRGEESSNKPWHLRSEDDGDTWSVVGRLLDVDDPYRHRPYVRTARDRRGHLHVLFTEGHPREFPSTSIYHATLCDGVWYDSSGALIERERGQPLHPGDATCLYRGTPEARAWTADLAITDEGRPVAAFTVRREPADRVDLPRGDPRAGLDLRYHHAIWADGRWHQQQVAYAGRCLYPFEADYAGGMCLHPTDPTVCFCSSSVDPRTGKQLALAHSASEKDNASGHQLYRIYVSDPQRVRVEALTDDRAADNLRPLAVAGDAGETVLLWMHGRYRRFTDYHTAVHAAVLPPT